MKHVSETIRLGTGIEKTGMIEPDRIDLCLDFLKEQEAVGSSLGSIAFPGVATEVLRIASNGRDLCERIAQETSWDVKIISGGEEARLTYVGLQDLVPDDSACAIVDIGGGSTEIVVIDPSGQVTYQESFPIGSGRLADRHFESDPPGHDGTDAALADAERELAAVDMNGGNLDLVMLAGGSGMFMDQLVTKLFKGEAFTAETMRKLLDHLAEHPAAETLTLIDIPLARARVLPASVAVALAFMRHSAAPEARGVPSGLRMGLMREFQPTS